MGKDAAIGLPRRANSIADSLEHLKAPRISKHPHVIGGELPGCLVFLHDSEASGRRVVDIPVIGTWDPRVSENGLQGSRVVLKQ